MPFAMTMERQRAGLLLSRLYRFLLFLLSFFWRVRGVFSLMFANLLADLCSLCTTLSLSVPGERFYLCKILVSRKSAVFFSPSMSLYVYFSASNDFP